MSTSRSPNPAFTSVSPVLTVIIPVFREAESVNTCLRHLASCERAEEIEVIIVDGDHGSTVAAVRPGFQIRSVITTPGRGLQLDRGARLAGAPVLVFLHVDTRPPKEFVRRITTAVQKRPAGAFDLHIRTTNAIVHLISITGMIRSRLTRIPYGDQVQFITKPLYEQIGGYPHIPIMEDVALMDALKERRVRIAILRPPAHTSDRRWQKEGRIRTTLRNWRLMVAYRRGVRPERLVKHYLPHSE